MVRLFARVGIAAGLGSRLPVRAYLLIQASQSESGEIEAFRIGPGWPTTPIEIVLDLLWYAMILFPTVTFLLRYLEQPSILHLLEVSAFVFLIVADRVAVGILYSKGRRAIREVLHTEESEREASPTGQDSDLPQDWVRRTTGDHRRRQGK
jgi:hypothetical protein